MFQSLLSVKNHRVDPGQSIAMGEKWRCSYHSHGSPATPMAGEGPGFRLVR